MKKKLLSILTIASALVLVYQLLDSYYYKSYNGNKDIVFIEYKGTAEKNYMELFELPQLKGKWLYVTLNLRGDWDLYKPDLEMMDSLYRALSSSNVKFLYTVDSIDKYKHRYDWKKTIKKYELKGFHIDLPEGYEYGLWEDSIEGNSKRTKIPKYMIVSNKGEIIDKDAPRPSNYNELIKKFNELLK